MKKLDSILAKIDKADQHVTDLCKGKAKWTLSVPIQPTDSDIVIRDALADSRMVIKRLRREDSTSKGVSDG